jgi:aminomethyltransferase
MSNLRTALYDWHVRHKARMVPFAGWDMPVQYAGIIEEHKAVRSGAGIFDIGHMARLSLHGTDALPLIEKLFTNSVQPMHEGQVKYGLVCNEAGGILDDILVTRYVDHFGICVNASNREKIVAWIRQHAMGMDAELLDHTFTTAMIAVQGPRAVEMVAGLIGNDVKAMKYYYAKHSRYKGHVCIVSRTGYTGEDGYELVVQNTYAEDLWIDLHDAGVVACGLGARDTLRLEAAMPLYGHELTEEITPLQAQLAWAVKFDKGDFVGRTALDLAKAGPTVRVGMELEGKRAAREGSGLFAGDTAIGTVTSGSFVPHLEKSITMGYVPPEYAAVGTPILVDVRGSKLPAKVVPMPFYKRKK